MVGRGCFFAIDDRQLKQLRSTNGDLLRRAFLNELEEQIDQKFVQETDKAWQRLQMSIYGFRNTQHEHILSNEEFIFLSTIFKESRIIASNSKRLHKGEGSVITWIHKDTLQEYLRLFSKLDKQCLYERYAFEMKRWDVPEIQPSDQEFEYLYAWYTKIIAFIEKTAQLNLHLLFSA